VIYLAPTILEVARLPEPVSVNGVQQMPLHGVSMAYSFDDADAADRHETQYFEMFGNRGIYHKGWTAVTRHKTPWILVGELHELQRLWLIEATKYNVLPLDDRVGERINPDLAGCRCSSRATPSCCSAAWGGSRRARWSTSRTSPTRSPPRSSCPSPAPKG
jgi:arylsulfatase